jgi:hypothetical protein
MLGDENEQLRKLIERLPKCLKCGHTMLVHTFKFREKPSVPVGCAGINKEGCDCTGWDKAQAEVKD